MRITIDNLPNAIAEFGFTHDRHFADVMRLADEEAERLNHAYLGSEHQVLGLVREGSNPVLTDMGVNIGIARNAVEMIVGREDRLIIRPRPLSPNAAAVVDFSIGEGKRLGETQLDPGLLLLGLTARAEGIGIGVLEYLGVSLNRVRRVELERRAALRR